MNPRRHLRHMAVLALLALAALVAVTQDAEAGTGARRHAPFDRGCIGYGDFWCEVPSEEARNGRLSGSTTPWPCVYYGPPFVFPCLTTVTSGAGVHLTLTVRGPVTVSARVRNLETIQQRLPGDLEGRACLALRERSSGHGYAGYGCKRIPAGKAVTIWSIFERAPLDPGAYTAWVYVQGSARSLLVEQISHKGWSR